MIKRILFSATLFLSCLNIFATHIVGGELNYKCLGGNTYEIRLRVYRDCYTGVPPFDDPAAVGIFDSNNVLLQTLYIKYPGKTVLPPTIAQADVCVKTPSTVCVEVCEYVTTVVLPPRAGGYQLAYQRCCRNPTISNITNPGNAGATYYASIPDMAVACNSNPVFKNWPPIFVCTGNPIVFDHSATDFESDSIVYNLCTPLHGANSTNSQPQPPNAPPYTFVNWRAPYNLSNLLGGTPLSIDPKTGLLTGTPNTIGQFVVGVCADEYRKGVLISTTKRDFQFNVIKCQPSVVVAAPSVSVNCTNHKATFTNNSTGASSYFWDFGDQTTLTDTSNITNPTYTYPGLGTYYVTLIARSNVSSTCNDTLRNFPVKIDTCPPCAMSLSVTKVNGVCGKNTGCKAKPISLSDWSSKTPPSPDSCSAAGIFAWVTKGCSPDPFGTSSSNTYYICGATSQVITGAQWTSCTIPTGACAGGFFANMDGGTHFEYICPCASGGSGITNTPGNATVSPAGGNAPYSYLWSTSPAQTGATSTKLTAGTYTVTVTDANGCQKTISEIIDSNSNIALTTGQTSLSACGTNDATATVTPSGGAGSFTYSWSTTPPQTGATATGLKSGTYTVIVTDSIGCNKSAKITIAKPIIITVSTSKTDVKCKGVPNGTATVPAPTTGTAPYTYSWSTTPVQTTPTATGLTTGYYVVTVTDANGCIGSSSVIIADSSMTLSPSSTDVSCYGNSTGIVAIAITGGALNFTYSWNSSPVQTTASASGLPAGTYIGKVIDAIGCTDSVIITIAEPYLLKPETKNTSTASCTGAPTGGGHVDVSGGTGPFTYSWCNSQTSADATNLPAGICIVTVTDSKGCVNTDTLDIIYPKPFTLTTLKIDPSCNGNKDGAVTVSPVGGTPGYAYTWSTLPAQSDQTADSLAVGSYSVTVTDSQGCNATLSIIISEASAFNLQASVTQGCNTNISQAKVVATGGSPGYFYSWNTSPPQSDSIATGLLPGIYIVKITDSKGCSDTANVTVAGSNPNIIADFTVMYQYSCSAGVLATFINTGTGATSWLWNFGDGTTSQLKDPVHKFEYGQTTTITLIAIGAYGCSDTMNLVLTIKPFNDYLNLEVPNVFTPNGDGKNDCFQIHVGNNLEACVQITIYDRWGLKMYDNENGICWDGKGPSGGNVPDGTYFYLMKISDKGVHGTLTLIR